MDLHETIKPSADGNQAEFEQTSRQEEDFGKMSPSKDEKNAGQPFINPESHIPNNLIDSDEKFIAEQSGEHIPHEDDDEETHPVQNGASPKDREEDFDFEKKLPDIPHGNERNESETQMKFSTTHFQDEEPVDEEELYHPKPEVKQEEYSHADVEEDDDEEVVEPAQEVNHFKQQEKSPEAAAVPPVKQEEIFTPSPSHRSPSPVLAPEEPKHEEHFKSTESPASAEKLISTSPPPSSQPETKSHQVVEPVKAVAADLAEPLKTRSVKSTKSEGRSFLGRWFDLSRLNSRVVDLVYWRDPRKSGIVLGAVLAILLSLSVVSVVSVFSYSALAVLTGTLSFRLYKNVLQAVQKTQDGHPFKEYLEKDVTVTTEKVHEVADLTAARLNGALVELRRLFLVEDLVDSVKFALVLWALTYVGSWFNGLTLVILGVIGLFSLPKVYETHQEKIDQNVDLVRGKINDIVDKVQAVLPIGKKVKSQ